MPTDPTPDAARIAGMPSVPFNVAGAAHYLTHLQRLALSGNSPELVTNGWSVRSLHRFGYCDVPVREAPGQYRARLTENGLRLRAHLAAQEPRG